MGGNHILITSVHGNPNIGLYGYCTDKYCIVGRDINKEKQAEIKKILRVPVNGLEIHPGETVRVIISKSTGLRP